MSRQLHLANLAEALGIRAYGGAESIALPTNAPTWYGSGAPFQCFEQAAPDRPAPEVWIVSRASQAPSQGAWLALPYSDDVIAWHLQRALDRLLDGSGIPGTLVRIGGHGGVLLTGASGIGKSHLALELLHRGHALVSDDLVCINTAGKTLLGRAPAHGHGRLALRGLGVIDVSTHLGATAVAHSTPACLLIHLSSHAGDNAIEGTWRTAGLLGRAIPCVHLRPGPSTATLAEAALREGVLRRHGRGSASAWIDEHGETVRCG